MASDAVGTDIGTGTAKETSSKKEATDTSEVAADRLRSFVERIERL
jgi:hypothetical protein